MGECKVQMVLGRLDSSERKKVEELAQSWNEQGAPMKFKSSRFFIVLRLFLALNLFYFT